MKIKEKVFFVSGMHCASCEVLIEKKVLKIKGVKFAQADAAKGKLIIEYKGQEPKINFLNSLFKEEGYRFSEHQARNQKQESPKSYITAFIIAGISIFIFYLLSRSGIGGFLNVNAKSSLPTFFIFGLIAGVSSCAALVGGIILSMSKQWADLYSAESSFAKKTSPLILFNLGRLISYTLFGAVLGLIGSKIAFSFTFSSVLVLIIAIVMIVLALQMLGIKYFRNFQITLPKSITRYIADESNFKAKYLPSFLGALTFFLPCGFTLTAQGLALLSGNALQGSLIMLIFALGTLPALLAIGFGSAKLLEKQHLTSVFVKVAGILVLFFAFYNINAQFNVLGLPNFSSINLQKKETLITSDNSENDLPPIVDGKQVIKMQANSSGYTPNTFKVRTNVPVRWEITDTGTSGCTNAILSRSLFPDPVQLTPGKTSVQEFTPTTPGNYRFSCWMGMVNGSIEVVDTNNKTSNNRVKSNSSTYVII